MAMTIEKVLISDSVDESCRQILEAGGISVDYKTGLSKPELLAIVKVKLWRSPFKLIFIATLHVPLVSHSSLAMGTGALCLVYYS